MKTARDRHDLLLVEACIRARCPTAVSADFQTSDQQLYGFVLLDVALADGRLLSRVDPDGLQHLEDQIRPLVCDLDWDEAMGEDTTGWVQRPLRLHPAQEPAPDPPPSTSTQH